MLSIPGIPLRISNRESWWPTRFPLSSVFFWGGTHEKKKHGKTPGASRSSYPIGSMYAISANIGGILMVNVTIYSIHGSYGYAAAQGHLPPISGGRRPAARAGGAAALRRDLGDLAARGTAAGGDLWTSAVEGLGGRSHEYVMGH